MKKLLAIVVLGLLLCNYGNTEEPDLGMATFGFSCDPILGKAKDKIYIGFVKEDGFFFRLGLDEQENAFFSIEDTPLYFESINDKDHSLKDVYIWYDIWVIESKVIPIWFHNVLYYDENKQKHFYSINHFNIASDDKKLRKAAKRKTRFGPAMTPNLLAYTSHYAWIMHVVPALAWIMRGLCMDFPCG